ncbi:MAG: hypothetical protein AAF171_15750 [Cyanobacteria bacterium P01_A01_bin.116]
MYKHPEQEIATVLAAFDHDISQTVRDTRAIAEVLERVEDWVADDALLTKIIGDYLIRYSAQVSEEDAELLVDQIVKEEIIDHWQTNSAAARLNDIHQTLLTYDRQDSLLITYIKVLQRGKLRADNSPEQAKLLESGLVVERRGKLQVANKLYQHVFDLDWVEQQLPGITRPVSIVSSRYNRPSSASKLFAKIAIAILGIGILGAVVSAYIRDANGRAFAIQEPARLDAAEQPLTDEQGSAAQKQEPVVVSDKDLFDAGIEQGKNGRWMLMFREFCELKEDSVYFAPAKDQLAHWERLYAEETQTALEAATYEMLRSGNACPLTEDR